MAHPLGALAHDMTHFLRYKIGNDAVVNGLELAEQERWDEAAKLFQVGAHVAEVLAEASMPVEPGRAARWRRVCTARRQLCARARAAKS